MNKLIVLDPTHFHAALLQRKMYPQIAPIVHIYAAKESDITDYLQQIEQYNRRADNPTNWKNVVFSGENFLDKMSEEKSGNIIVLAGNNKKRIQYLQKAVNTGLNIIADKPLCINKSDFMILKDIFPLIKEKNLLLSDLMTERYEITNILQKIFINDPALFGELISGTVKEPAVTKNSIHHFLKKIAGKNIKRPAWYFDISQTGEGMVDVTTHLIDQVHWACFPEETINIDSDINIIHADHWSTDISKGQFEKVTMLKEYPQYLKPYIKDDILHVNANGEINYTIKGHHIRVVINWKYEAAQGEGDSHFSKIRGTLANIIIRQNGENPQPEIYIEPSKEKNSSLLQNSLQNLIYNLQDDYPGLDIEKIDTKWHIIIPTKYRIGHEAHFSRLIEHYLLSLENGGYEIREMDNMLAKYFITAHALELAKRNN
jgi:predicted dehydrogenase